MPQTNKSLFKIIPIAVLLLGFVLPKICFAQKYDIEKLKKAAEAYAGSKGSGGSRSSQVASKAKAKQQALPKPENRFIEIDEPELSSSDKLYVTMHMKLANRHFSKKDYEKAEKEIASVLRRQPSHGGAHFMKAVISGRKKKYDEAWYYILVAKDKDSKQSQISSFINKLSTVSKEPASPSWVKGIYRGIPKSACDKICDIIEKFLKTKTSQNVFSITVGDFSPSNVSVPITVAFTPEAPSSSEIKKAFQASSNVVISNDSLNSNKWTATFKITDLPYENSKAVPLTAVKEFVEGINEEIDVAINDAEEVEAKNGTKQIDYKLAVRTFSVLNDFLRAISPYAKNYKVSNLVLGGNASSVIWKAEVSVLYLVSND